MPKKAAKKAVSLARTGEAKKTAKSAKSTPTRKSPGAKGKKAPKSAKAQVTRVAPAKERSKSTSPGKHSGRAKKKAAPKASRATTRTHKTHEHHDHDHDHDHDHEDCGHDHDHDHDDHEHHHVHATVRAQPLIAVSDVAKSSRWYATLLGGESLGGDTHGNVYDRVISEGELILQLHAWGEEEHHNLGQAGATQIGHGVLLWFEVDDFDAAVERARDLKAQVLEEPHVNPAAEHREIWLRDLDGYVVVVVSPDGEAAEE